MTTHRFEPTTFRTTIGEHEPVLRAASGDTISTWCVDATGRDARFKKITEGGNPQTGPFYVEGARPGDTLAVRFDSLRPNRTPGLTGEVVAENVVDPWFVRELPERSEEDADEWTLDLERGTARLGRPRHRLAGRRSAGADARLLRRGARVRPGALLCDLLAERREHGLRRLPRGRHRLQHTTTELMRMLEQDYGLDHRASSVLLGQLVRYDVGNVYDPAYTMVAKVEKRYLPERIA